MTSLGELYIAVRRSKINVRVFRVVDSTTLAVWIISSCHFFEVAREPGEDAYHQDDSHQGKEDYNTTAIST